MLAVNVAQLSCILLQFCVLPMSQLVCVKLILSVFLGLWLCLPSGTQIYSLNGTDPEGQEVRYGLSFDPGSKEYFRIDPISGNITLVEKLDREVNPTAQSDSFDNT